MALLRDPRILFEFFFIALGMRANFKGHFLYDMACCCVEYLFCAK